MSASSTSVRGRVAGRGIRGGGVGLFERSASSTLSTLVVAADREVTVSSTVDSGDKTVMSESLLPASMTPEVVNVEEVC